MSNLETASQKLLQIILMGQPELREVLDRRDLKQLKQRIAIRCHLPELNLDEVGHYIRHRLSVASVAEIFAPKRSPNP